MIDHKLRCIFIHQRKVAGMAIADAWGYEKWDIENLDSDFHQYNDGSLSWNWNSRTEDERTYFVFSAVRNPFDRLISSWKFLEDTRERKLIDVLLDMPRHSPAYEHLTRPQIEILREPGGKSLIVQDLIRYESLQSDFDRICDRVGKPRVKLLRRNTSEREDGYRQYFDSKTRAIAEKHFAQDLDVFGYEF